MPTTRRRYLHLTYRPASQNVSSFGTLRAKLSPGQHALRPTGDTCGGPDAALSQLRHSLVTKYGVVGGSAARSFDAHGRHDAANLRRARNRPAEARGTSDRCWGLPGSRPSRRRSSSQASDSGASGASRAPVSVEELAERLLTRNGRGWSQWSRPRKVDGGLLSRLLARPRCLQEKEAQNRQRESHARHRFLPPSRFALRRGKPANPRTREPANPRTREPANPRQYDAPDPGKVCPPSYLNRASCCQIVSAASVPKNSVDQTSVATRHGAGLIASGRAPRLSTISRNE